MIHRSPSKRSDDLPFWQSDACESYTCCREVRRPTMDTLTELGQLADDLTELGDTATAELVRQATNRFAAWKFEAGERLLERALEERLNHEHERPRSPYFNTCALVVG
jgi:hypothetical protein